MSLLSDLLTDLRSRAKVILATIISTSGSTPASALSRMVIAEDGTRLRGTVGGGCMESDVLHAAKNLSGQNRFEVLSFRLKEDEYVQGLICGGSLDVMLESVSEREISTFEKLQKIGDDGDDAVLVRWLNGDGTIARRVALRYPAGSADDLDGSISQAEFVAEMKNGFRRGEFRRLKGKNSELLIEPIAGNPSLFIFGGGHVGCEISRVAASTGFRVTVIDDRPEFAQARRFPEAAATVCARLPDAVGQIELKSTSYVVIATHGHRDDEGILEMVVSRDVKYIGMVGSKRKVLTTYERLRKRGISDEFLAKVHAPMGIEIGSANPSEIAISVVAELTAIRRGVAPPFDHKSTAIAPLVAGRDAQKQGT